MHYIAIFTVYCNDAIVKAIEVAYSSVGADSAEAIIDSLFKQSLLGRGLVSDAAMLIYIGIVFQTIFYLIAYINRMLKVGFLLVISPLITLTYAIDKMGDGKAQALGSWLKEYIYTILIQPFHCIIYFSFISVAFSLVSIPDSGDAQYSQIAAGLLAILCLKFINDGENVVRKIFGFQDDNSKTSMAAGAVLGVAVVKNANKMAKSVKTGFSTGKAFASKFSKDLTKDLGNPATPFGKLANKVKDSPLGEAASTAKKGINAAKETISDSGIGRGAKAVGRVASAPIRGAKSLSGKIKNSTVGQSVRKFANSDRGKMAGRLIKAGARRSVDGAVAMLGFAATYATGDTDMLTAIGYGSAMKKGADELLTSSDSTNKADAVQTLEDAAKYEEEEIKSNKKRYAYCETAKRHLDAATKYLDDAAEARKDPSKVKEAERLERQAEKERAAFKSDIAMYRALENNQDFLQYKDENGKKVAYTDEELVRDEERMEAMKARDDEYTKQQEKLRSKKSVSNRLKRMKSAAVDKEIKAEAKEIESLLRQITSRRHLKAKSGRDEKSDQEIVTMEDMEFAGQMASVIDANIQKNLLQHSGLSAEEMYKELGLSKDYGIGAADTQMKVLMLQLENSVRRQQQNYAAKELQGSRKTSQAMLGKDADSGLKDTVGAKFDEHLINVASSDE